MGYPQITLRSFWVTTISAQIMPLCTESHVVFFPLCFASEDFFLLCFAACIVLPLPTLNFTFPSQFLCIKRSFRTPTISPIFTTSDQFNIANKLLKVSSWRGQSYCVYLALLASASSSWWLWEEPREGGLECSAAMRLLLVQWGLFILLRASWISTVRGPGELPWVHMPGTSAVKHWLPAQLVMQAVVNLLAQTPHTNCCRHVS